MVGESSIRSRSKMKPITARRSEVVPIKTVLLIKEPIAEKNAWEIPYGFFLPRIFPPL